MKVKLEEGAILPTRAHETDAGYDLYSPCEFVLEPLTDQTHGLLSEKGRPVLCDYCRGRATIDTGVHVQLPKGTCGILMSKSGLNVKHGIISTGLIDEGYTGSIVVKLYNLGDEYYHVHAGDKITQLVIQKYEAPELEVVDELDETDRGGNGFGSTGK